MVIAFILMQLDVKPMRLKGLPAVAGIAIGCSSSSVRAGEYVALRSRKPVVVLSAGGHALPDPRFDSAYRLCAPVPLAFRPEVADIPEIMDEIFVRAEESIRMEEGELDRQIFQIDLYGFWLPCRFETGNGDVVGYGWVMQEETMLRYRMLSDEKASTRSFASISIENMPDARIVIA